jgi:cytoskeletal protein RodZ
VDEEISLTYQKIRSVDEQIARATEQLSRLERQDPRHEPRRRSRGTAALRGVIGLLLAVCIGGAALIWQSSYGDTVRFRLAGWVPINVAMSSPSQAESTVPVQPSLAAAEPAKAEPAPPAPAAEGASDTAAPTAAAVPPEVTELLHKMAGDLANVQQGIEQLKASQDQLRANQVQMSIDNAKFADELRTRQEQMARVAATTADKTPDKPAGNAPPQPFGPNARRNTAAAPAPRAAVAAARKPTPAAPAPRAAVRRSAPVQLDSAQQ